MDHVYVGVSQKAKEAKDKAMALGNESIRKQFDCSKTFNTKVIFVI